MSSYIQDKKILMSGNNANFISEKRLQKLSASSKR